MKERVRRPQCCASRQSSYTLPLSHTYPDGLGALLDRRRNHVKKQIVLNCTPQETRVAIVEGNQLAEIYIERLRNRGILLIEAQTMQQNTPAITMYTKLGFKQVDEGVMYRKDS